MTPFKKWLLSNTIAGGNGCWAILKIDIQKRSVFRDSMFGPYPMPIPDDIVFTEDEQNLKLENSQQIHEWLNTDQPSCVGFWAVQVTPEQELIKFGEYGGTVFPYEKDQDALAQLKYLNENEPNCSYYLLQVFSNGQMKTFDF